MARDKVTKVAAADATTQGGSGTPPANGGSDGDSLDAILAEGKCIPVEICGTRAGRSVTVQGTGTEGAVPVSGSVDFSVPPGQSIPVSGPIGLDGVPQPLPVQLQRSASFPSADQALWVAIRNRTNAIGFAEYDRFITSVLCAQTSPPTQREEDLIDPADRYGAGLAGRTPEQLHFGVDAYQLLKAATQAFLILECGVVIDPATYQQNDEAPRLGRSLSPEQIQGALGSYMQNGLPYIRRILGALRPAPLPVSPYCDTLVTASPDDPCLLELIWSYWHEEGMMVQAMNAISLRFQNKRTGGEREPMAELELSPLRPLSNLIWGYIQDEPFRLSVARRTYEYLHHYGLAVRGRAVPSLRPAESRSKFLEAFHSLLYQTAQFYEKDADTTVIADGFPVLNGLKEVHMLLAEGAHNQFGDLPWTARAEMLIQQWLLSRQEMREFLRGRQMVPYRELWMGQVDTVKRLYGWTDTPVTQFHDLADYGEKVLLSIRYGDWIDVYEENRAKNWARYWKNDIQSYIHSYRVATGVDLTASAQRTQPVNATPPAVLLQQRLAQQRAR